MFDLNNNNISYLLFSPENSKLSITENNTIRSKFVNLLYTMNYTIISLDTFHNGIYEKCFLCICSEDNETLKNESIFIMNQFNKNDIILKYKNEQLLSKIIFNGNEAYMNINYYDSDITKKVYIHEGISFTLNEQKRYFFPKKKEDLKPGMVIEYFNNNKWCSKKVINVNTEYDKMYKLLMKYEKIRLVHE